MVLWKETTASEQQTVNCGARLADYILAQRGNDCAGDPLPTVTFLALYGDLGAGKTHFVTGLASRIAPDALVQSPTYAIVNEYVGLRKLCHFDLYRLDGPDDLESIGFYDYTHAIFAVEWCERIPEALPARYYRVNIEPVVENPGMRRIICEWIDGDQKGSSV